MITSLLSSGRLMRSERQLFVIVANSMWLSRLGSYLYGRILKDGIDHRFTKLKMSFISFLAPWCGQAVWTTFIQLPVVLLNDVPDHSTRVTLLDLVGMFAWLVGFAFELVADSQKAAFRAHEKNRDRFITHGLWRYSRHPNYFGEILMWCAMALLASSEHIVNAVDCGFNGRCVIAALSQRAVAAWLSPLFTAFLLLKVSGVSMLEPLGLKKWGNDPLYLHYMKNTSRVIPSWPARPFGKTDEK
jgi:steroid 5-alpha reductase family enzyme